MQAEDVVAHPMPRSAAFPNNPGCPLLVYPGALTSARADLADRFEALFTANGWPAAWRNGVFPFHHWHSSAHEVLGIYSGRVTVQFGGERGPCIEAGPGDVIVVPAGVAHRRVAAQGTLGVVGAYPAGQSPDHCQLGDGADQGARIDRVAKPARDPVFGAGGPLSLLWPGSPGSG